MPLASHLATELSLTALKRIIACGARLKVLGGTVAVRNDKLLLLTYWHGQKEAWAADVLVETPHSFRSLAQRVGFASLDAALNWALTESEMGKEHLDA